MSPRLQPPPTPRERQAAGALLIALAITVVVSNVPGLQLVLYPFRIFTTWVHEMGHGLMAMLAGGTFVELVLEPDSSGLARHAGVTGPFARGLVASAGYLGAAFFGAVVVASRASRRAARVVLLGLSASLLLSVLLWVSNLFGMVACTLMGLGMGALALKTDRRWLPALLTYLGAQTCVNALLDIRALYGFGGRSDAVTLSELAWFPPWFWATTWLLMSIAALILALRWSPGIGAGIRVVRRVRPGR